jgi:hypothetical protein
MRRLINATTAILATVAVVTLMPDLGLAQNPQQVPMPPGGFKPPPAAPVKPYKPIAITPPAPYDDQSFVAFRKQLTEVAQHKDRAGLAKLVVPQGFFWMQDKDLADKRKPSIDNLAAAIHLNAKDDSGWAAVAGYAADPTASPLPDRQGVVCAPADPTIDQKAFQELTQSTKTEPPDWGYPTKEGVDVHSTAKPNSPVTEKLGLNLVRVLPDSTPGDDPDQPQFLHIALPSGKTGYVPEDAISGLGGDAMCYSKGPGGWMITGFFGGAPNQ